MSGHSESCGGASAPEYGQQVCAEILTIDWRNRNTIKEKGR